MEKALSRHVAPPRRLIELECRPSIYNTSFAMVELDVRLDDDTRFRLLYKDLSRHALLEDARQAKPIFLYDLLREIETYRSILGTNRLGTAECYGTIVDPSVERYGLFLEKVPGLERYQVGDLATCGPIARGRLWAVPDRGYRGTRRGMEQLFENHTGSSGNW